MIFALLNHASNQSVLDFGTGRNSKKGKAPADGLRQTQLPFQSAKKCTKKVETQQERLKEMALKALGMSTLH
jgi:hypothetical protein